MFLARGYAHIGKSSYEKMSIFDIMGRTIDAMQNSLEAYKIAGYSPDILLSQLDNLTFTQSKKLENQIKYQCSIKTIEDVAGHAENCPHCASSAFYKWDVRSGLQRYKCKELQDV